MEMGNLTESLVKTETKNKAGKLPVGFDELNHVYPLRPITDDADLDNATEVANALAVLSKRSKDQEDYLETLSLLIERYEDEHYAIDTSKLDAVGTLKFLMEQRDMSAGDVRAGSGESAKAWRGDCAARSRQMSKANILAAGNQSILQGGSGWGVFERGVGGGRIAVEAGVKQKDRE